MIILVIFGKQTVILEEHTIKKTRTVIFYRFSGKVDPFLAKTENLGKF